MATPLRPEPSSRARVEVDDAESSRVPSTRGKQRTTARPAHPHGFSPLDRPVRELRHLALTAEVPGRSSQESIIDRPTHEHTSANLSGLQVATTVIPTKGRPRSRLGDSRHTIRAHLNISREET